MHKIFEAGRCALVGMVHLAPLPGSPRWAGDMTRVLDDARRDAEALIEGGCDALIVENMGDLPYSRATVSPETVASMAIATSAVAALGLPTGVQVLAGANREALGVAVSSGASFIRVEAFAYAHVADEGLLQACAGELLRARRALGVDVKVWADIKKKHASHSITADLPISEIASGNAFCGADALIVTGVATGRPVDLEDVMQAHSAGLPIAIGSGVNGDNVVALSRIAGALIVGSWLKVGGDWRAPVDVERVRLLKTRMDEGASS